MPYDYYEYMKKQRDNDEYIEVSELVRQTLWSETIDFRLSQEWLKIEDIIFLKLYLNLRYN